jgi:16S rRNA (guanine527-N7)-methyltransferase
MGRQKRTGNRDKKTQTGRKAGGGRPEAGGRRGEKRGGRSEAGGRRGEKGGGRPEAGGRRGEKGGGRPNTRIDRKGPPPIATPEKMGQLMAHYGFPLPREKVELLTRFHAYLIDRNRKLNLTRIWNLDEMVVKHYVDCLIITRFVKEIPGPLLDIGTGGGFPGIPLKILLPDLHIILGEGVRKRVNFLSDTRAELGLEKLDVIGRNIDKDFEYPVNSVITRAVEPMQETLRRVQNCLLHGGLAMFMKGPAVGPEKEEVNRKFAGFYEEVADHAYTLPKTDYKRRLVVYRKSGRVGVEE